MFYRLLVCCLCLSLYDPNVSISFDHMLKKVVTIERQKEVSTMGFH